MSKVTFVRKVANVEDLATGLAEDVFEFPKVDGELGRISIKRSLLNPSEADRVAAMLRDRNADLGTKERDLVSLAISSKPEILLVQAPMMGWQDGNTAFVTSQGVVGAKRGKREYTLPAWLNTKHMLPQGTSGTLEEWQEKVATPCLSSSVAILTISAAFAAPLLKFSRLQSFGVNIFGVSKAGKTAALLAASSVAGIGQENRLPNFRSTAAAKSELGRVYNDQLLPMNEVGLVQGQKQRAYEQIRAFIYALSEGRDVIRHSNSEYTAPATVSEFRTIMISTAEHSFDHYAERAGETRDDGEYARCLDVPAAFGGRATIMDRLESGKEGAARTAEARNIVVKLRKACSVQYGTAFKPYIEYLVKFSEELPERVPKMINTFCNDLTTSHLDGALQHAARNFGLLYAGAKLAIEANVLPYRVADVREVLAALFLQAVDQTNSRPNPRKHVVTILRRQMGEVPRLRDVKSGERSAIRAYYVIAKGERQYFVQTAEFKRWFERDDFVPIALRILDEKNCLKTQAGKRSKNKDETNEWAVTSKKWPSGKKGVRVYSFRLPPALRSK